jgi:hypothetical protein
MMAATLLGQVLLHQGSVDRGLSVLLDVEAWTSCDRVLMDWIWEMPLRLGLAEAWLHKRKFELARQAASRLLQIAQQPGEKTYMALGSILLAEISLAETNLEMADRHASKAVELVQANRLPMAAPSTYRTAAKICASQRLLSAAGEYWARERTVCEQLARALSDAPALKDSLLRSSSEALRLQKRNSA